MEFAMDSAGLCDSESALQRKDCGKEISATLAIGPLALYIRGDSPLLKAGKSGM
jgi:hypothetical protein